MQQAPDWSDSDETVASEAPLAGELVISDSESEDETCLVPPPSHLHSQPATQPAVQPAAPRQRPLQQVSMVGQAPTAGASVQHCGPVAAAAAEPAAAGPEPDSPTGLELDEGPTSLGGCWQQPTYHMHSSGGSASPSGSPAQQHPTAGRSSSPAQASPSGAQQPGPSCSPSPAMGDFCVTGRKVDARPAAAAAAAAAAAGARPSVRDWSDDESSSGDEFPTPTGEGGRCNDAAVLSCMSRAAGGVPAHLPAFFPLIAGRRAHKGGLTGLTQLDPASIVIARPNHSGSTAACG